MSSIRKWIVVEPKGTPKGCLLALPGRNIAGDVMEGICRHINLPKSLLVCLEPEGLQWYPAPMGPQNQYSAINAMKESVERLENAIQKIERDWSMPRSRIGILGFSAGSVMAIQMAATSQKPFAGIVSLSGAILEPEKLPKAQNETPILLQHNRDDSCFKWGERYIPMKRALMDNGYRLWVCERDEGEHTICPEDCRLTEKFLGPYLGYTNDKKKAENEPQARIFHEGAD